MKGIDWQAFHDGSMSENERGEIRRLMASDPKLQAEYQGFQAFQRQVRAALTADAIPMGRLENALHAVVQSHGPRVALGPLMGMVVAGAVISAFLFIGSPSQDLPSVTKPITPAAPMEAFLASDPIKARDWVKAHAHFDAPADLAADGKLKRVSAGTGRVQYEYDIDGKTFYVNICLATDAGPVTGGTKTDGGIFFSGYDNVGFRKKGLAYNVQGPQREVNWRLAIKLNKNCNALPASPLTSPFDSCAK